MKWLAFFLMIILFIALSACSMKKTMPIEKVLAIEKLDNCLGLTVLTITEDDKKTVKVECVKAQNKSTGF